MSNNSMWFNCSRSHSLEPKQRHRFYNHLNFHLLNGLDSVQTWRVDVSWAIFCRALRFRSTASLRARSGKLQVLISWSKNLSKFIQILCLLEHHCHVVWWCLLQFLIVPFHPFPNSVQSLLWSTGFSGLTTSSACPWAMGIWRQVASWHSSSFGWSHASPGSPPVVITWAGRDGNSMTPSTQLNEWCSLKGLVVSDRKAREFEAFDRSKFKRASIAAVCLATHSYTCRLSSFMKNPLEGCPKGKRLEHFEAEISALGNALRGKALAPGYMPCIL